MQIYSTNINYIRLYNPVCRIPISCLKTRRLDLTEVCFLPHCLTRMSSATNGSSFILVFFKIIFVLMKKKSKPGTWFFTWYLLCSGFEFNRYEYYILNYRTGEIGLNGTSLNFFWTGYLWLLLVTLFFAAAAKVLLSQWWYFLLAPYLKIEFWTL